MGFPWKGLWGWWDSAPPDVPNLVNPFAKFPVAHACAIQVQLMQKTNPEKAAEMFLQVKSTVSHLNYKYRDTMQKDLWELVGAAKAFEPDAPQKESRIAPSHLGMTPVFLQAPATAAGRGIPRLCFLQRWPEEEMWFEHNYEVQRAPPPHTHSLDTTQSNTGLRTTACSSF